MRHCLYVRPGMFVLLKIYSVSWRFTSHRKLFCLWTATCLHCICTLHTVSCTCLRHTIRTGIIYIYTCQITELCVRNVLLNIYRRFLLLTTWIIMPGMHVPTDNTNTDIKKSLSCIYFLLYHYLLLSTLFFVTLTILFSLPRYFTCNKGSGIGSVLIGS